MYHEELLDHYRFARHKCRLDAPHFQGEEKNYACGDRVYIEGIVREGILEKVCFQGEGCILSQATASLLLESCSGKSLTQILSLTHEDVIRLVGMPVGPTRSKCVLLSLHVLRKGIASVPSDKSFS